MSEFEAMRGNPTSRRTFIATMTAAGLGLAATQLLANGLTPPTLIAPVDPPSGYPSGMTSDFPGIPGATIDEVVLNFALALEILEADLYRQALNQASGLALSTPLNADPATYSLTIGTGGLGVGPTIAAYEYLRDFAYVEAAHREFLRMAITASNGTPIAPNPGGYAFPGGPGGDLAAIITNLFPLEETGVRGYLGAAPYLTTLSLVQTAASLFSTECRHSAALAYVLNGNIGPRKLSGDIRVTPAQVKENEFEFFKLPADVLTAASGFFL